jgi:serine/threonine protein kinase
MSDTLHDRVTAALGDTYEVGREIGRGGMGVVYGGSDRKLRRGVAIKVLPPELAYRDDVRQRFLREAQTAAQLSHPNIVPIYAVEERGGLVCFIMALVDGESLAARISRDRRLPIDAVCHILGGVAEALAYAHQHGIVHRDIKPDNILIDRATGRPMVTDFGIARAAEGDARLTVTGIAVGTPAYMSPEQAMGEREIDGRSDIYSLAIVGYQMLSGELPFHAANTPAMLMKHISDIPRPLRDFRGDAPPALLSALETAMAKKPAERFATALEFRDALTRAPVPGAGQALAALRPPAMPRPNEAQDGLRASSAWKHSVPRDPAAGGVRDAIRAMRQASESSREQTERHPGKIVRDAIDAANAGWRSRIPSASPQPGPLAPVPPWMPPSWRDARRQWRGQHREALEHRRSGRFDRLGEMSLSDRIRSFRRRTASSAITVGMLASINLAFSPEFWWFLFPAAGMMIGLMHRGASLWADGIRIKDVFGADAQRHLAERESAGRQVAALSPAQLAEKLAPPDVVAGPHGNVVIRAAQDRQTIHEAVNKLSKADSDLIPDVLPTVDALAERVGSLALALHRLDEDVRPGIVEDLDQRIAAARAQPESREREQKLQLLERQRSTVGDLMGRRGTLVSQLESASLMLQNMRLDLIALRSAGVQSVINDVSSATQEARALSREIGHVLDAAREVR